MDQPKKYVKRVFVKKNAMQKRKIVFNKQCG